MKAIIAIPASVALVLSVAACDRPAAPAVENSTATADAAAAEAEAVKQAFATFNADIAAKKVDAIRAHYASDAVMILPGQAPFTGIDAIMGDYDQYAADKAGKYVPGAEATTVSSGGDVAYGEVKYQTTFTNPATKAVETKDRYNITVYKKQSDGSWKIVRDVNTDVPKAS